MPISLGYRRWKFSKSCGSSVKRRRRNKLDDSEKPVTNHDDIVNRALQIYELGLISRTEYMLIVESDLKCRNQTAHGVRECHVKLPPNSPHVVVDPITLEALGENKFVYTTPAGSLIEYNIESLVLYLTATKDFRDPVTRVPYNESDIRDLDRISLDLNKDHMELYEIFQKQSESKEDVESRQRIQELQSLETCLGEIISDMQKIIEKKISQSDAQLRLSLLFSEFEVPFEYMKSLNIETAYVNLISWIEFLKGPPKRPTSNRSGGLELAISFLNCQFSDSDKAKINSMRGASDDTIRESDISYEEPAPV